MPSSPFADCVEAAHKAGITAIIQPGGSIHDQDSIDAANKYNIAMIFYWNETLQTLIDYGFVFFLTQDIAIDLGTANTIIIMNDKMVVNEPSIVAVDKKKQRR